MAPQTQLMAHQTQWMDLQAPQSLWMAPQTQWRAPRPSGWPPRPCGWPLDQHSTRAWADLAYTTPAAVPILPPLYSYTTILAGGANLPT